MLDLTNQRFGKLLAICHTDERKGGSVVWKCLCDCGNTIHVVSRDLASNKKTSCGCDKAKHQYKQYVRKDTLVGQRFGKLVVLEATDQRKQGAIVWECLCDCGNTVLADTHQLNNGYTQSCGCLKRESADERIKGQAKQLVGQRFGRLTVVGAEKRSGTSVVWKCKCDCGNVTYADLSTLKSGRKKSCGCIGRERSEQGKEKLEREMIGQRFGRLTVLGISEIQRKGGTLLECLCDCGNTTLAYKSQLVHGMKKSCGCLRKECTEQSWRNGTEIVSGQQYGRLTVLRRSDERINKTPVWECKCKCGNLTLATSYQLRKGLNNPVGAC